MCMHYKIYAVIKRTLPFGISAITVKILHLNGQIMILDFWGIVEQF